MISSSPAMGGSFWIRSIVRSMTAGIFTQSCSRSDAGDAPSGGGQSESAFFAGVLDAVAVEVLSEDEVDSDFASPPSDAPDAAVVLVDVESSAFFLPLDDLRSTLAQ